MTFDPELPPVQPHGYDQPGTKPLDLHNNGHTGKNPGSIEEKSPSSDLTSQGKYAFSQLLDSEQASSVNMEK